MPRGAPRSSPTFGIITALPHEFRAVVAQLDDPRRLDIEPGEGPTHLVGTIPSRNGRHIVAVLLLPDAGNNSAGIGAALLSATFPSIRYFIMTGVAGGVPNPDSPAEHVRLGDIVVSNRDGVVQYDYGKSTTNGFVAKHPPRPPSARLLQVARLLVASGCNETLDALVATGLDAAGFTRPAEERDRLAGPSQPGRVFQHPHDPQRFGRTPRVFLGPIASANRVLKDPALRDALRDRYGVKAVEMEGSGIADAAWTRSIDYFVVRGVADYCDANKNDEWQPYAAVTAAAYTRLLLAAVPSPIPSRFRKSALALASVPLLAFALAALGRTTNSPARDGALYIQARTLPLQLSLDGRYVKTLTASLPFTSLEVPSGTHTLVALSEAGRETQRVQVRAGETLIVEIGTSR